MALSYDNSAFYYFAITFLSLYAIPSGLFLAYRLYSWAVTTKAALPEAVTEAQKKQFEELKSKQKSLSRLCTPCVTGCFVAFAIAVLLLWLLLSLVSSEGQIAVYDPFSILGLETGVSESVIKKAYRKLSLQFHPDKNPNDPVAAEMFMKVAKAYEALTDPIARENFEKFGNPDGKQSLEVSIGLPTFLLDADKKTLVVMVYLAVLVICVPAVVFFWYNSTKDYNEKNIMNQSYYFYYRSITEGFSLKNLPELLIETPDFRNMPMKAAGKGLADEVTALSKTLRTKGTMQKPSIVPQLDKAAPSVFGLYVGMQAYLSKVPLSPQLQGDVHTVLRKADDLVDAMLEVARSKNGPRSNYKPAILTILEFNQRLTQCVWGKDSSLLQIPHFTDVEVGHCTRGKGGMSNLGEYVQAAATTSVDGLKGLRDFAPDQLQEIMDFLRIVPRCSVDVKLEVADEEGVCEGDVVTVSVTLTHENLEDGDPVPPVHSPEFPFVKKERWTLLLANEKNQLVGFHDMTNLDRVATASMKFLCPPQLKSGAGYSYKLDVVSRDYVGLDQRLAVKFNPGPKRPELETHEEDKNLGNEGSLFDQLGGAGDDTDSDTDYSDDEDDGAGPSTPTAGAGAGAGANSNDTPSKPMTAEEVKEAELDAALGPAAAGLSLGQKQRKYRRLMAKQQKSASSSSGGAPEGKGADEDDDDDE